jgi:antitoxin VapB
MIQSTRGATHGDLMALNIRNRQAEDLAAEVARLAGETKTEAVTVALRERLARLQRRRGAGRLANELDDIALHCSRLPIVDPRPADDILGYDDHGLPR